MGSTWEWHSQNAFSKACFGSDEQNMAKYIKVLKIMEIYPTGSMK